MATSSDNKSTRASLLDRLKNKEDHQAWQDFDQTYWHVIYGYARRTGCDHHEAEEIVQEVAIKVFKSIRTFEYDKGKGRFRSYLKTLTRTTAIDTIRKRSRRIEGGTRVSNNLDDGNDRIGEIPDPRHPTTPDPFEEQWRQSVLTVALARVRDRVTERTFESFRMYALEGQPASKVAKELGIAESTVFANKTRMLRWLKEEVRAIENDL